MGYITDQKGIINRYLREQGGWDTHLSRTREYILEGVKAVGPETVTILGSGWLLDVPLQELASITDHVNLVDINHPSQIRRKVGEYKNVSLIEDDITGGIAAMIPRIIKEGINSDSLKIPLYDPAYIKGMVISVNILTQLDMLPADYLAGKCNCRNEDLRIFRRKIQEAHIDFLKQQTSVLISDCSEEIWRDKEKLEVNNLLFTSFPRGGMEREWIWDFDSGGAYYRRLNVHFRVKAVMMASAGS